MSIINKPNEYFNTVLYTGTGATQSITGVNFTPDLTWIKGRSGATNHALYDVARGTTKDIGSNLDTAETTQATGLTTFGTDGFTVGALAKLNTSSATYSSWNWKAGGTAVSNTDGSITSSVSANTTAGFSIVSYATAVDWGAQTIGHGLGVVPKMIIAKNRDTAVYWTVYHESMGNLVQIKLNTTEASVASDSWNYTTPTSSVFSVGATTANNEPNKNIIAYCFADVKGYSKFGSYTGNGSADGTFVHLGFSASFFMLKRTDAVAGWTMFDNKRNTTYNPHIHWLIASANSAEDTDATGGIDFTANGVKIRSSFGSRNASGGTYIYMAFAENPFVTSTGIPATAR